VLPDRRLTLERPRVGECEWLIVRTRQPESSASIEQTFGGTRNAGRVLVTLCDRRSVPEAALPSGW